MDSNSICIKKSHILVINHQITCTSSLDHKIAKKLNSKRFPKADIRLNQ